MENEIIEHLTQEVLKVAEGCSMNLGFNRHVMLRGWGEGKREMVRYGRIAVDVRFRRGLTNFDSSLS